MPESPSFFFFFNWRLPRGTGPHIDLALVRGAPGEATDSPQESNHSGWLRQYRKVRVQTEGVPPRRCPGSAVEDQVAHILGPLFAMWAKGGWRCVDAVEVGLAEWAVTGTQLCHYSLLVPCQPGGRLGWASSGHLPVVVSPHPRAPSIPAEAFDAGLRSLEVDGHLLLFVGGGVFGERVHGLIPADVRVSGDPYEM